MTQNNHIDYIPLQQFWQQKHQRTKVSDMQLLKKKISVKYLAQELIQGIDSQGVSPYLAILFSGI